MSPIRRIGEPDPRRGTEAEASVPGRFAGKTAIVTGAGSGIGRATACRLAAEGAAVGCLDVAPDNVGAVVAEINERAGGSGDPPALALRCDVTDEGSVTDAVATVADRLGSPRVLCNIAGIGGFRHTTELSLEEWNRVLAVNLTGTFLMTRAVLPHLLEDGGVIVNTSSTAGLMGQPYSAAYCASKGGVSLMTRALAVEFADRNVRVNAVAPGGVDTPILWDFGFPEGANMKLIERMMSPVGYATPAEVAGAFAYLASDEAAYVTGSILSVDGAITA